jgi:hypothetical protein
VHGDALPHAARLLLTAETSCYWYWTGQDVWDAQVTQAANRGIDLVKSEVDRIVSSSLDRTGPTIFPPWVLPENPGGKMWGQGGLIDAPRQGTLHTFIFDVSGVKSAKLVVRSGGQDMIIVMADAGPYASRTSPRATATHFTAELPVGLGDVRYYVEAVDGRGNVSRSSLERIFLA